ncbi:MAG: NAD(P)-dependent oxidoreductase [Myxococcota bacterium]
MEHRVFIGTGLIGAGMVEAALERGEKVRVWNRTRAKAEALAELGAVVADTPAEAVRGQSRVHLVLTSDAAVDEILEAIGPALDPEAIVLDHSTTSPPGSKARAERCAEAGVQYLHAPIFMSPQACRTAQGMILACGPKARFEAVETELSAMTGRVWYFGERLDAAATFKLVGNALNLSVLGGLSDVYSMAAEQGFTPQQCQEMLEGFDLRFTVAGRGARMARGDYETQWTLKMARKDIGLMIDAAGQRPLTVLPALAQRMDGLIDEGQGERDVAIIGRDATKDTKR